MWVVALLAVLGGCGGGDLSADRLPTSTSVLDVPDREALLVADGDAVYLDGDKLVGHAKAMSGGMLVSDVYLALQERADSIRLVAAQDPEAPVFEGRIGLEIDRDLPADLLLRLVYSAAQAEFDKPWLVVADSGRNRHGIKMVLPAVAATGVATARASGAPVAGEYANPTVEVDPARGFVVHAHDRTVDPGAGLVLACPAMPCTDGGWPVIELNRLARRIKLDHARDRAVVVVPGDGATVQAVVGALDATRHDALAGRGARELFPDAILATGVP